MKLQDAYVAETGAYLGNWDKIGYSVPGVQSGSDGSRVGTTTNFVYAEGNGGATFGNGTASLPNAAPSAGAGLWTAKNILKLNECAGDQKNWELAAYKGADATGGQYVWATHQGTSCDALTPNFKNLGSTTF